MFRDCWRCGMGWRTSAGGSPSCPTCTGLSNEIAQYIKYLHTEQIVLRKIARKAFDSQDLSNEERSKIGIHY